MLSFVLSCRYAALVWRPGEWSLCPYHHRCVGWPGNYFCPIHLCMPFSHDPCSCSRHPWSYCTDRWNGGVLGGLHVPSWSFQIYKDLWTELTVGNFLPSQGTHESLRGNSRALSTVTAIIDGTGSIGKWGMSGWWRRVGYLIIFLGRRSHPKRLSSFTPASRKTHETHQTLMVVIKIIGLSTLSQLVDFLVDMLLVN